MSDADVFFKGLTTALEKEPLPRDLENEDELEQAIVPAVRGYTSEHLGADLREILYYHHNTNWPESKQYQNVAILGRNNTSDIFIRHPSVGTIFIDLKLTKRRQTKARSDGSDDFTGSIQRAIGQAIIASMRHPNVISFVAHWGTGPEREYDATARLIATLWNERRVKLILRNLEKERLATP